MRNSADSTCGSAVAARTQKNVASLPPVIAVVVPTCGRLHLLERCLAALCAQSLDPSRYEIVVVDDARGAACRATVIQWAARARGRGPAIVYRATAGAEGPAVARNRGWRAAHANLIAFTDDDTEPSFDWVERGLNAFEGAVDAAWGRIIMPISSDPTDYERDAQGLESAEFVTANCFCTRQALVRIGGFDERYRLAWREDADLYFKLLSSGARIVRVDDAVVVHPVRPARWGVSVSQQRKVMFDALLFKTHPKLYREKIRRSPRWDYYAIVLVLVGVMLGVAFHLFFVTTIASLLWLALTTRFALKRLAHTSRRASHVFEMTVTSCLIPLLSVYWRARGAIKFRVAFF